LLAPSVIVLTLFVAYPFGRTIWLGFYETDPFGENRRFVGGSQFAGTLTSDEFTSSLWVSFRFTLLTVPTGLTLGLVLAVLAHQRLRGMAIYRTIFSSTVATSAAVASLMFLAVLSPSVGVVNQMIRWLGGQPIYFLQSSTWALIALAAVTVWQNLGIVFIVGSGDNNEHLIALAVGQAAMTVSTTAALRSVKIGAATFGVEVTVGPMSRPRASDREAADRGP
jgi:sn-glycerol 3-phosphate transport system permease protein